MNEVATASPWAGRPKRRHQGFETKHEAILDTAAAMMARRGYDGMSMGDLADQLNITKPTLYHYVGGKEQLFAAVVARSQAMTIAMISKIAAGPGSGYARLRAILIGYAEIVGSDAGTGLIFSTQADVGPDASLAIKARAREANALIFQVMAEGNADGSLTIADPAITLQTLFGALNWAPSWIRPDGPLTVREIAEHQADILLEGVRRR